MRFFRVKSTLIGINKTGIILRVSNNVQEKYGEFSIFFADHISPVIYKPALITLTKAKVDCGVKMDNIK